MSIMFECETKDAGTMVVTEEEYNLLKAKDCLAEVTSTEDPLTIEDVYGPDYP